MLKHAFVSSHSDDELRRRLVTLAEVARVHQEEKAKLKATVALQDLARLKAGSERRRAELDFLSARTKKLTERRVTIVKTVEVQAGPPRFVEGIFWFVLPRKVREAVMGDAAEAYAETMKRCGGSRFWASVDYCKEAVFAIIGSMRMSAAQWISLLFKRSS
jgi:hypothetical protein